MFCRRRRYLRVCDRPYDEARSPQALKDDNEGGEILSPAVGRSLAAGLHDDGRHLPGLIARRKCPGEIEGRIAAQLSDSSVRVNV